MKKIAVIEDNSDIFDPVISELSKEYEVIQIHTFKEAYNSVDLLRSVDLILLDLIMQSKENDEEMPYPSITFLHNLREKHNIQCPGIAFSRITNLSKKITDNLSSLNVPVVVFESIPPSELMDIIGSVLT
jgi:DNA-binding response OmpR family regulator